MSRPYFISFEGTEGGGKTTQIKLLSNYLAARGCEVLVTRQPGGDPVGVELRKILLDLGRDNVCLRTELLLMMADRSQSVETVIKPHLERGGVVLCDRYIDSSTAYQGAGRGIDIAWITALNNYATAGLLPNLTFILDLPSEIGLNRQQDRNKMELLDTAFHERVRREYLHIAEHNPARVKIVDASLPIVDVHLQIRSIVEGLYLNC